MWELFRQTPNLTWIILTKRPQNIVQFLPSDWGDGYQNVWLGTSVENRTNGYPRMDALRSVPATVRFLSCEPLIVGLDDVDLTDFHWVIVGGESGPQARPFDVEWARSIKRQCKNFSSTFFFKQLGRRPKENGIPFALTQRKPTGQKDVSGVIPENFPADLRIQQWP